MPRTVSPQAPFPRLRALVAAAALLLLGGLPAAASAGAPPWTDAPYTFYAENQPLTRVLGEFAATFSLSLQLSPQVSGTVNGRFATRNPTEFLDRMSGVYGFNWFTHAGTLFVSRSTEMDTRSISASGGSIAGMRQALSSLGVLDNRFGWGELPEQGVALVSGPPAYVALVQRTVAALPLVAGGQQVAVFRLKHASVDDRTILYRDRQITTAGLAQVLRNLVTGAGTGGGYNDSITAMAAPLRTDMPTAGSAPPLVSATPDAAPAAGASASGPNAPIGAGGRVVGSPGGRRLIPSIQADSRLNAIIVQDIPERLPLYRKLIDQLDVPTALIEIEAMIIDVNSSKLDQLGIAWGSRRGGNTLGYGDLTSSGAGTELTVAHTSGSATVDPTSLVVSTGNYLVSRIRALESLGDATIQSRPSILTVDNIGALLDLSETFYIRTTGERVATVTPITVGTTLRVTPHYVEREGGPVVQLDVDIEDGQIQDRLVDNLPTIRKSVVSTQAIVGENQTLLIGGYKSQQRTAANDRVPGLGRLPIIGLFFSNKVDNSQVRERLFMIKPRLVTLPVRDPVTGMLPPVVEPPTLGGSAPTVLMTSPWMRTPVPASALPALTPGLGGLGGP